MNCTKKKCKYDGVIFDVDGTLWDSVDVCALAWNSVLAEDGSFPANVKSEQLMGLFGKPMDQIFTALFPDISKELILKLSDLCIERENAILPDNPGTPYEGVIDTIRRIYEEYDIPMFVVSNCQSGYIEICIDCLGVTDCIVDKTCFGDNPVSKGSNILEIMKKHNLKHPVYVGDTLGDEQACEEAGIDFIYAEYGFGEAKSPVATIKSFAQLPDVLL